MVKSLDAPYEAGRRGAGWLKVKPAHTLDLVVLAAEWGHGRRQGKLSNLHLGARDPDGGGFVMLGKTFKGMTDEMLAWQTEHLLGLETHREGHAVHVRPELVVEIAFDGVQASSRYPGGVALRFARVKGYRPDKSPAEADTIATVRAIHARSGVTSFRSGHRLRGRFGHDALRDSPRMGVHRDARRDLRDDRRRDRRRSCGRSRSTASGRRSASCSSGCPSRSSSRRSPSRSRRRSGRSRTSATRWPLASRGRRRLQELRRTPTTSSSSPGIRSRIVELGDLTVGELVSEPGWRWSDARAPDRRRGVVPGTACGLRDLRELGRRIHGRVASDLRTGGCLRHSARTRRVHGRRRALRAGRVDGHSGVGRLSHGNPQPGPRHFAVHRPRRLDEDGRRARRLAVA